MLEIRRADPERPIPGLGDLRRARSRRELDHASLFVVVDARGGAGGEGVDVPDDGDDAGVVLQLRRHGDGFLLVRFVVLDDEGQGTAIDPALEVDLIDRHLGGEMHRAAVRLVDRASQADVDRRLGATGAARSESGEGERRGDAAELPHDVHGNSDERVRRPPIWRSKSSRMRRYWSVQELGSTKLW